MADKPKTDETNCKPNFVHCLIKLMTLNGSKWPPGSDKKGHRWPSQI